MKHLYTFFAIMAIGFTVSAQITAGTLVYEAEVKYNPKGLYAEYREQSDLVESDEMKSTYTVEFNERYIKTYSYSSTNYNGKESYWSLIDKINNKTVISRINEKDKTVRFIDPNPKMPEYTLDYSYGYYDEEETLDLDNYHEEFYIDLMRLPPRDTIIYHTNETQDILGYACTKTIVKIREIGTTIYWHTNQISGAEALYTSYDIKGTVLLMEATTDYFIIKSKAVSFSPGTNLPSDNLSIVPEGYTLNLGELYLNSNETKESINSWLALPHVIEIEEAPETLSKVITEINNAITPNKKYAYVYQTFYLKFTIDETGKVTSVELLENQDEYNYYDEDNTHDTNAEIDMKMLNKKVKKNCSLKSPITVFGKSKKTVLTINYSYTYEKSSGYKNYRD